MAKTKSGTQDYPRIKDEESRFYDCLDETQLNPHIRRIQVSQLQEIIARAIETANKKSSRTMMAVLDVLLAGHSKDEPDVEVPDDVLNSFGDCCRKHGLLDENDCFFDAHKLADLFCGGEITEKGRKK